MFTTDVQDFKTRVSDNPKLLKKSNYFYKPYLQTKLLNKKQVQIETFPIDHMKFNNASKWADVTKLIF